METNRNKQSKSLIKSDEHKSCAWRANRMQNRCKTAAKCCKISLLLFWHLSLMFIGSQFEARRNRHLYFTLFFDLSQSDLMRRRLYKWRQANTPDSQPLYSWNNTCRVSGVLLTSLCKRWLHDNWDLAERHWKGLQLCSVKKQERNAMC